MLDAMSSPQSIERPTMTVPSFDTYSARVQASVGAEAAETTIAAMAATNGPRKALVVCMADFLWAENAEQGRITGANHCLRGRERSAPGLPPGTTAIGMYLEACAGVANFDDRRQRGWSIPIRATGRSWPIVALRDCPPLLLFGVSRFALMPDCQDQHDVLGRQPAILGDVAVLATRQHEFAPTLFRDSPQ